MAQRYAQEMEEYAKVNAPWNDQTGRAREGLYGVALRQRNGKISIVLSYADDVDYGAYLELRWAGRYATILPTREVFISIIERELMQRFNGR